MDAVRNLEVTFRSLGGGSEEKMQEDWERIDLKKCLFSCSRRLPTMCIVVNDAGLKRRYFRCCCQEQKHTIKTL